jgi:hypothetical protein
MLTVSRARRSLCPIFGEKAAPRGAFSMDTYVAEGTNELPTVVPRYSKVVTLFRAMSCCEYLYESSICFIVGSRACI